MNPRLSRLAIAFAAATALLASTLPSRAVSYYIMTNTSWDTSSTWSPNFTTGPDTNSVATVVLFTNRVLNNYTSPNNYPSVVLNKLGLSGNGAILSGSGELIFTTNDLGTLPSVENTGNNRIFRLNERLNLTTNTMFFIGASGGAGNFITVNSNVVGSGSVVVSNASTTGGAVVLNGSNSYAGGTVIKLGTLQANSSFALGTGAVANSGTLSFNNAQPITYLGGLISGTGKVIMTGSSVLTLSGSNTYTSGTTISNGTLIAAHGGALGSGPVLVASSASLRLSNGVYTLANGVTNNGLVEVHSGGTWTLTNNQLVAGNGGLNIASGGTLGGIGTFQSLSVSNLGTISPGSSPGTLTFSSNLTLGASSVLNIELGGTNAVEFDRLLVGGALTLGGTLNVTLTNGYTPNNGDTLNVLDWGSIFGTFSSIYLPSAQWSTNSLYTDGTLVYSAIPEPGAAFVLSLGLGLLVWVRKRS
jgi:fibronectin-binding autotransporter adhesin